MARKGFEETGWPLIKVLERSKFRNLGLALSVFGATDGIFRQRSDTVVK